MTLPISRILVQALLLSLFWLALSALALKPI